jgi:hypothetical protein
MTTELVEAYTAAGSDSDRAAVVATFAEKFAKGTKSITAKLVAEKVYRKAETAGKKGGVKKADLVSEITEIVPMAENDASSLEKATMRALRAILAAVS